MSFRKADSDLLKIGAPGCVNDSLLTGMQFVEGFESNFFVSRWTMHQLVSYVNKVFYGKLNPTR